MLCPYSIMLRSLSCCHLHNKKDILIYIKFYTEEGYLILSCYLNNAFLKDEVFTSEIKIY